MRKAPRLILIILLVSISLLAEEEHTKEDFQVLFKPSVHILKAVQQNSENFSDLKRVDSRDNITGYSFKLYNIHEGAVLLNKKNKYMLFGIVLNKNLTASEISSFNSKHAYSRIDRYQGKLQLIHNLDFTEGIVPRQIIYEIFCYINGYRYYLDNY